MTEQNHEKEENLGQEVDELLEEGLNQKQIQERGYSPSLIRQRVRKRTKAGKAPPGGGCDSNNTKYEIMKIGSNQTIAPESVVDALDLPQDGETSPAWRSGYKTAMWQVFGTARLLQILSAGQADLVRSQMDLYRESRETSRDIAQQTGLEVANALESKLPKQQPNLDAASKTPNPWQSMLVETVRPYFQHLFGQAMGAFQGFAPQGQPGVQGASPFPGMASPQPEQGSGSIASGAQQASKEEIEEAFNDE